MLCGCEGIGSVTHSLLIHIFIYTLSGAVQIVVSTVPSNQSSQDAYEELLGEL